MPDNTNTGSTTRDGAAIAAEGGNPQQTAGGSGPLTAGRQIGVNADEAGDNDIVATHNDEKGHLPTGGTAH